MNKRSEFAWHRFREKVSELGGIVLEPAWLGKDVPHRIRCSEGHQGSPRPGDVRDGTGICRVCAGQDPATAARQFRERIAAMGGVVLEPSWLGNNTPHLIRCAAGHETRPRPAAIQQGRGCCKVCAGKDPVSAERRFRARVAQLGGTVVAQQWRGVGAPHRVVCAEGHDCSPYPQDVQQGGGLCRACAGNDPVSAELWFRTRVEELGGRVVEPSWLGNKAPHRAICAAGHECSPRPNDVQQGEGICRPCGGKRWDVFYTVTNPRLRHLKIGITSGDPRPRLADHAANGFTLASLILTDLPGTIAPELEVAVMTACRLAGEYPVRGREYFDARALGVVLNTVGSALPIITAGAVRP